MDDKSEEDFQKVQEYFIAFCEFVKPVPGEKYFDVGRRPQTIAWHAFAAKHIVNRTMQLDEQDFKLLTDKTLVCT